MTPTQPARVDYIQIEDHRFAVSVSWVSVSTACGCTRTVTVWKAEGSEDRRPAEAEAARWASILAGGIGLDRPLAVCDWRRLQ